MTCLVDLSIMQWSLGDRGVCWGVSGQLRGAPKAVLQHPDLILLLHVFCHVKQGEGTLLQGTQTEI